MRASDFIVRKKFYSEASITLGSMPSETKKQLSWNSLDENISVADKILIFETYHKHGNLKESIDEDKKSYFISLFKMSDTLSKDKKFIVVPMSLIDNKIILLDNPGYMKFVRKVDGQLIFNYNNREIKYPSETIRDLSIFNTFTFLDTNSYNKFKVALSLKFDIDLPVVKININEVKETTLNDLYHDNYPDQDELIWNFIGTNDFDVPFTIRKINPLDLEELITDNYSVNDVQDLFKKMQPEQETIISDYQNDPSLSQQIIVLSGRRILDGHHRALAAVLANKPINYIDVSEEQ